MARKKFTSSEWKKIMTLADSSAKGFGLPKRRRKSVVIGTFNIRKLGAVKKRSAQAWSLLEMICRQFDLLAVQEVMDDLSGLRELKKRLGDDYGLFVSDVTGVFPGAQGNAERLAFLFNWRRVERTELASDITYDRSRIVQNLFENRRRFSRAWTKHQKRLKKWEAKVKAAKAAGKKKPGKPVTLLPRFLTFIRQPHCASFQVRARKSAKPYDFLVVNAHLLYGENPDERKWEFDALIEWLNLRAKQKDKMYHRNILMMGDCNLEFEEGRVKREEIDAQLRRLNKTVLKSKKAAKVNFPLLNEHRLQGVLRTNLRLTETYDQIACYAHDKRLPAPEANKTAPKGLDAYNFGVFNLTDLFAQALYGESFALLSASQQEAIIEKAEHDVSDHMPAWIRLPIPGA